MTEPRHTPQELDCDPSVDRSHPGKRPRAVRSYFPPTRVFANSTMKCHFPDLGLMMGYAVTARVSTDQPPSQVRPGVIRAGLLAFHCCAARPQGGGSPGYRLPPEGAMWGSGTRTCTKPWGAWAWLRKAAAHDLDGVRKLDFHFFSTHIMPTHGHGAFIDYGGAVRVAGLAVKPATCSSPTSTACSTYPPEIPLWSWRTLRA